MDAELILRRNWRCRHPRRGRIELAAGTYAVPEDLPDELARRAVDEGVGERRRVFREADLVPVSEGFKAKPAPKPKRRRAKGPAPENRSLGRAPEDR